VEAGEGGAQGRRPRAGGDVRGDEGGDGGEGDALTQPDGRPGGEDGGQGEPRGGEGRGPERGGRAGLGQGEGDDARRQYGAAADGVGQAAARKLGGGVAPQEGGLDEALREGRVRKREGGYVRVVERRKN
jgi:hypothetical protein